ncbi:MAG: calcium/sodium antiporter [Thermodesulfobacteria bacterium]|nr:calcium/sodium antiporter [Thermodesulfobacteriota bacterium]
MTQIIIIFFQLVLGIVFLVAGAEFVTHHCIVLARHLGVRPIIVGLTVVAFGTSAPEFFVTVMANLQGQAGLAVGNIIGSNIANIGLILGVAATIMPFAVPMRLVRVELPFLVLSVILIGVASWQGVLTRLAALVLIVSFGIYLFILFEKRGAYTQGAETEEPSESLEPRYLFRTAIIVLSFCSLIFGSHLLIKGAVSAARLFHCPELIIGLTLTALGTSLPELASTISALRRKETGLIIGNVLGSNFANSCGILGTAALIKPLPIDHHVLVADFPVMAALSLALIPIFRDGKISRLEGFILLGAYISYIAIIYLKI